MHDPACLRDHRPRVVTRVQTMGTRYNDSCVLGMVCCCLLIFDSISCAESLIALSSFSQRSLVLVHSVLFLSILCTRAQTHFPIPM